MKLKYDSDGTEYELDMRNNGDFRVGKNEEVHFPVKPKKAHGAVTSEMNSLAFDPNGLSEELLKDVIPGM